MRLIVEKTCELSFPTMKRVKTDGRASSGDERVENLMRLILEGPNLLRYTRSQLDKLVGKKDSEIDGNDF